MVGGPGLNKNTMQGKHQGSRTLLPYRRAMRPAGCLLLPPYLPCHDTRYPLIHNEQEWGQLLIRYLVPIIKTELIHSFPHNTKDLSRNSLANCRGISTLSSDTDWHVPSLFILCALYPSFLNTSYICQVHNTHVLWLLVNPHAQSPHPQGLTITAL